jgi:transposase IS116/IS110/IS902 family protein
MTPASRPWALLQATGTTLTGLHGMGPSGAARLLAGAGEVTRFPAKAHFASWDGTAPTGASSGDQVRHRLPGAGNRQTSRVLHIMAVAGSATPPRAAPTTTASVLSPPGHGTTLHVQLPAGPSAAPTPPRGTLSPLPVWRTSRRDEDS